MKTYLTRQTCQRWNTESLSPKAAALLYDSFVLPFDTAVEELLDTHDDTKTRDKLKGMVMGYPKTLMRPPSIAFEPDAAVRLGATDAVAGLHARLRDIKRTLPEVPNPVLEPDRKMSEQDLDQLAAAIEPLSAFWMTLTPPRKS